MAVGLTVLLVVLLIVASPLTARLVSVSAAAGRVHAPGQGMASRAERHYTVRRAQAV